MREVRVLGVRQPQRAGDRVEYLRGHVPSVALLEAGVVRDGHPGQLRQLLAAQPRHPAVPPEVRQAHVLGLQPGPAGAQKLAELGTPVQRLSGPLYGFGLFVHASSIHGRTTVNLSPPVVGPLDVGKTVVWVSSGRPGRLIVVPGRRQPAHYPPARRTPA
ncbi:hypothetical protein SAV31267_061190 [Streptomyces avermitilis]|uniref:Uncharacterized protein n=1 Tax=Streptomyces avermitilis TaxID=33903 RepID=A0A4D4MXZ4_STRAX|nr:hypothetical protein SAV31267_061190 [Streptomyces avermitilis]